MPLVGHITIPMSQWLRVPVVLTIYAGINYVILFLAKLFDFKSPLFEVTQMMDLGNLLQFLTVAEKAGETQVVHGLRHVRMSIIPGPHAWIKTTLLSMSWTSCTQVEKLNIMFPLFLTMASKLYSVVQIKRHFWHDFRQQPPVRASDRVLLHPNGLLRCVRREARRGACEDSLLIALPEGILKTELDARAECGALVFSEDQHR